MNNLTIFINSSDGFEDCWDPFFKLFKKYWPNCNYPILLNTEIKDYSYDGLNIKATKVSSQDLSKKLTWSECLILALEQIETPFVLYMQEDYFLDTEVNKSHIDDFIQLMLQKIDIAYIGLTNNGNYPPFKISEVDNRLFEVSAKGKYRISTQAGIWRKEVIKSYLLPHENGWMFEIFGTLRAHKRRELFLTINREYYFNKPIISYTLTGIIKSKWHENIPTLFKDNGIYIDYNKRGFYKEKNVFSRKIETAARLFKNPLSVFKSLFSN